MNPITVVPTTQSCPFGRSYSGANLFKVKPGIPISDALEQIAMNLTQAAMLCGESEDADLRISRAMNQVIAQLIDSSSALASAALGGLRNSGLEA